MTRCFPFFGVNTVVWVFGFVVPRILHLHFSLILSRDPPKEAFLSPVEVMKDTLLRVREVNLTYNCICFLENEQTLIDKAAAAEQRYLQGKPSGKLDGIPITIKDLLYVPDMPTLNGSMLPPHKEHPLITPCVLSIIQEGGIIIGKTTTSDFGWKAVTVCPRTGITRNPYDADRITGGSSGGSATAVALGIAPLSIGSDAGGSLRIPAGFCGVVTLKATIGVVPHAPVSVFGSLSTVGPFARDVRDLSLLLDVIVDVRKIQVSIVTAWKVQAKKPRFQKRFNSNSLHFQCIGVHRALQRKSPCLQNDTVDLWLGAPAS
ncbi:putative amidase [Planoprotostelium fungivorum]|uniref:Putative amidase n=1 Tax=Planoprotostelium fungivorum TaxID=1890364 RepID=A0A2P6MU58_9EUKA|nr:putative amidase [Planoprotostelium fungivorum]